jgi:hypothetical protein
VYVHPQYDQACGTDFDIALLEINPGNKNGLLPDTQLNVTLMNNDYASVFEPKTMGWGRNYAEDPSKKPEGILRVSGPLNMSTDGECREGWPEFNYACSNGCDNAVWQQCTKQYQELPGGPGPCDYDTGSPLFWTPEGQTSPTYLIGMLSQVKGSTCPKEFAGWAKISELKDFICTYAPCENDTGAKSMSATLALCRWTAITVHNLLGLLVCGVVIPVSLCIRVLTYEMAPKVPDKSGTKRVPLLYLRDYFPASDKAVMSCDVILLIVSIVAVSIRNTMLTF